MAKKIIIFKFDDNNDHVLYEKRHSLPVIKFTL